MPLVQFPRARRTVANDGAVPDAFVRQVAEALSHLHDVARLQIHPLALRLDAPRRPNDGLGRALQQTLLDAIEALRPARVGPPEHSGRIHRLVVLRYVEGLEPQAVWALLGIGKSEYYREHSRGLAALASVMWQRLTSDDDRARDIPFRFAKARQRLPQPFTSFVGRDRELRELDELLQLSRFVTLTGPPGTGKTRLALQVAGQAGRRVRDGVVFVGLASLPEPSHVLPALAQVLGLQEQPGRVVVDQLTDALSGREMLLVIDNFEHVIEAGPELARVLSACVHLRVLVTSRELLHLAGEHAYAVMPLDEHDAVQLFAERARAARADFLMTPSDVETVATICARVDRLPLAIELAAGRVRLFGPRALLARLERRLPLLSGGPRDEAPRHQTLRATIGWSYDLLPPVEQAVFCKLAVCVGGCSLEAIQALCGGDPLDAVGSLVEKACSVRNQGSTGSLASGYWRPCVNMHWSAWRKAVRRQPCVARTPITSAVLPSKPKPSTSDRPRARRSTCSNRSTPTCVPRSSGRSMRANCRLDSRSPVHCGDSSFIAII